MTSTDTITAHIARSRELADKATEGLTRPSVSDIIASWSLYNSAANADSSVSIEEKHDATNVPQEKPANGGRLILILPKPIKSVKSHEGKFATPDTTPDGSESREKTTLNTTSKNGGSGPNGFHLELSQKATFESFSGAPQAAAFIATNLYQIRDSTPKTQGVLTMCYRAPEEESTELRTWLCVAGNVTLSKATDNTASRTLLPQYVEALSVAVAALKYAHEHSNDPVAFWLEEALSKIAAILSPP